MCVFDHPRLRLWIAKYYSVFRSADDADAEGMSVAMGPSDINTVSGVDFTIRLSEAQTVIVCISMSCEVLSGTMLPHEGPGHVNFAHAASRARGACTGSAGDISNTSGRVKPRSKPQHLILQ
jgi:hypothetical protein